MEFDYRRRARLSLERAKSEIALNDPVRLRYAALELRYAIEALVYDRARALKDFISPKEYGTWQPSKLVEVILEIDPHFGISSTISIGREDVPGEPAKVMQLMGTEVQLPTRDIKKHYQTLGNFLHIPTLKQLDENAEHDASKIVNKCKDVIAALDRVLSSKVWNALFGRVLDFPCSFPSCTATVRKRFVEEEELQKAKCLDCGAQYTFHLEPDGRYRAEPEVRKAPCTKCGEELTLWLHELTPGAGWKCECGRKNMLAYTIAAAGDDDV